MCNCVGKTRFNHTKIRCHYWKYNYKKQKKCPSKYRYAIACTPDVGLSNRNAVFCCAEYRGFEIRIPNGTALWAIYKLSFWVCLFFVSVSCVFVIYSCYAFLSIAGRWNYHFTFYHTTGCLSLVKLSRLSRLI